MMNGTRARMWNAAAGVLLTLALALPGCTGTSAEELYETALLEERQNNLPHARELYEQIMRDFPDSDYASRAAERLEDLQPKP